jgi:UDP-glucose 4-epimerase
MMKILITGGAGYIGSACAQVLLDAGHSVTIYDSLRNGHRAAVPEAACFIQADLADATALDQTLSEGRFDALMHFAALIVAGESMRDPGKYFYNNVALSISLFEKAFRAGIGRVVFSSTAAVFTSSDQPLSEDSSIGPSNVYGQTKLMIEQLLQWYGRVHGLGYAILRYFNAAGAQPGRGEDHPTESHLIPLVLQAANGQREKILLFGEDYPTPDGTAIRDYIHIADLASAHRLALEALKGSAELVYNLGNGTGYSVREVVETARAVTGREISVEVAPRRPGDAARLIASSEKIRRELGWVPSTPLLHDIIASAWEWHHTHPRGYNDRLAR